MSKLESILTILINSEIPNIISKKIEIATADFATSPTKIANYQEFNYQIAEYIRWIYREGLIVPIFLNDRQAFSEAISLLDGYYDSQGAIGYDAAYFDAIDESGKGIGFVRQEIAESIKAIELNRWVDSLFLTIIDPLDKQQRLELVKALLKKYADDLPENIQNGNPAQFANYYRQIIELVVSGERFAQSLINNKPDPRVN